MKDTIYWETLQCALNRDEETASKYPKKRRQLYEKMVKQIEQIEKKDPNAVISACNSYDFDLDF